MTTRREHDLLGDRDVPAEAYYGVHTLRAVENFPISGTPISIYPDLIAALASIKLAAAKSNRELGLLDGKLADVIVAASEEVRAGALHEQFVVDVIQGGAGTSTNMNANEVIANRALELMGADKGAYTTLHPIEDVNASQSTNDVYPTAVRIALWLGIERLLASMAFLRAGFEAKAEEFKDILKIGRTQLQDAVPMTLGQEFLTYAIMIGEDEARMREARALIQEINLGATAIGTGINAPGGYSDRACQLLAEISGVPVEKASNLIEATQDTGAFVQLSGVLKRVACKLSKICNDLRLLSSGPQAGFGDIRLPARQAGSSIMPGKVNPVIPEVMNQVAFEVIGNDMTVTMASEAGQLQLNAFEPVIAHSLLQSLSWMTNACRTLRVNCIDGITANTARLTQQVETSVGVVTALTPYIGYAASAALAHTALTTNSSIADLVVAAGLMSADEVARVLSPERLSGVAPITGVIVLPPVTVPDDIAKAQAESDES